ncbi:MAG: hypothetical protein H6511_01285 [Holophagales bacterium]|nr:hypothetical protein [Holophagales bacterium]
MHVNRLLAATAAVYALAGLALTFAPAEVATAAGLAISPEIVWLAQAFGAGLLALAWLNWLHRFTRTAGILGRSVVLPNLLFALALSLNGIAALRHGAAGERLFPAAIVFGILAIAFGSRLFVVTPAAGESGASEPEESESR